MYCNYCGSQISDDSFFCNKCGRNLGASPMLQKTTKTNGMDSVAPGSQYYPQNQYVQQPVQEKHNKKIDRGVYCAKCGTQMLPQVITEAARSSTKDKGPLYSVGRGMMIVGTGGLWALTGKKRSTTKTKFKSITVFVCPKCGRTRNA